MTAVIDTCVIIDVLQDRKPFSESAMEILLAVSNRELSGVLTAKAITDIFYILQRSLHDADAVKQQISKLFILFDIEDTKGLDCRLALDSDMADFEDSVMSQTAKRINADFIVTRNLKDYKHSLVPAVSPEEFLSILKEQKQ